MYRDINVQGRQFIKKLTNYLNKIYFSLIEEPVSGETGTFWHGGIFKIL